jgi:hypothetical protein
MSASVILSCLRTCNLACAHCYCNGSPTDPTRLSLRDVDQALLDLEHMGIDHPPFVDLTGGEFLVHPQAEEIAALVSARFPRACLILETNGTGFARGDTTAYDRIPFARLHMSVSHLHGNIEPDGSSPALAGAIKYQEQRDFELHINFIPRPAEPTLPACIEQARIRGVPINRFVHETLAPIGRGARLENKGPGVTVSKDRSGFFRCELGEAVFLDPDKHWYICHYPRPTTRVGAIGQRDLPSRYRAMLLSPSAQRLCSDGLVGVYLAHATGRSELLERRFHNRCEPCLLLQDNGFIDFDRGHAIE